MEAGRGRGEPDDPSRVLEESSWNFFERPGPVSSMHLEGHGLFQALGVLGRRREKEGL
jgi:hypothetical protein